MTQTDHKRLDVPIRLQIMVPSALCLAALFAALFWIAVPFVHDQLYSAKRDMIGEMTETAWFLLNNYSRRVQAGEIPLADAQSRAIERIRSMRFGPESQNYFWIIDLSGRVLMHPIQTNLEGTNGLDLVDSNGKRFIEEMVRIAREKEEGMVDYSWPYPERLDTPVRKMSYVQLFKPWNWVVGTGLYVDDIDAEVDRFTRRLQILFLGCFALLTGLTVWLGFLSRRSERRRHEAELKLQDSERQNRTSLENMVSGFALFELIRDGSGTLVDARVIQVNPAAVRITGVPFDPTGRTMSEMFPTTVRQRMAEVEEILRLGLPFGEDKFFIEFNRWFEVLAFMPQPNHLAITFTDITERKIAEEKIAHEMSLRQILIDQLPCAAMILKKQTREIVGCNQIARNLGAVPGCPCYEVFDKRKEPCSFCLAPESWESGLPQRAEVEHPRGRWCECIWISLSEDLYVHYVFDITERKTAEQALKASEQRFRNLIEASPDGIWEIDAENRYTYCSPQYLQLLGYEPQELIGRTPFDLMSPEEAPLVRNRFGEYIRDRRPFFNLENTCIRKNGTPIILETSGVPILDEQGCIRGYRGVDRDITERMRMLDTLQKNERQLCLIVENSTDIITSHDPDSTIRFISPGCRELLGYEPQELLGRKAAEMSHPDDAAKIQQRIQDAVGSHMVAYQLDHRIRHKNGGYVWFETRAHLLFDEAGRLTEIQCSLRDITERRKHEEALRVLNSRYQATLAAIPDIVAEVDVTKRYTWLNPAGLSFFGDDAVGRYAHEYFIGEQTTYQQVQPVFNGNNETVYVESWQRRRDGKRRLLAWWVRPLQDSSGKVVGALSTARDITEAQLAQRQREQLLSNLEMKNEELQSVLFTASHDLRSPLVNIQGFGGELDSALQKVKTLVASGSFAPDTRKDLDRLLADEVPEALHFVKAGAEKIQMLLDGLLRLSRVGSLEITLEPLNMDDMLGKVLHAQRFQIQQHNAEIVVDPLPPCVGDVVMVNQLFSNLIDNAMKYSDPSRRCRIHISGKVADGRVLYSVADNGVGIEPEHRQEIFQIFYRLHPGGTIPGEGLGLAIVKRILDRLGGDIHVESFVGQGTTFHVRLPMPEAEK